MITNIQIEYKYPLGHYFAVLSRTYLGALLETLETNCVDRYYMVVQVLADAKEPLSQQTLGNFLNVDKVTMVRIINHLTQKGIISGKSNPADRREKFLSLTAVGISAVEEINRAVKELNEGILQGFSEEEKKLFRNMLERANTNMLKIPTQTIYLNFKKSKTNV